MYRDEYHLRDFRYYGHLSYTDWLERKLWEVRECAQRADAARRHHDHELLENYGIIYDAPCDWYRKVTKGALDD